MMLDPLAAIAQRDGVERAVGREHGDEIAADAVHLRAETRADRDGGNGRVDGKAAGTPGHGAARGSGAGPQDRLRAGAVRDADPPAVRQALADLEEVAHRQVHRRTQRRVHVGREPDERL